jgi:hypothetical protein
MIQFVANYDDLSTDKGYQFKFYCDKCGNGFLSPFAPSTVGTAANLLNTVGGLFGGILGRVGDGAYQIQKAIGGKGHDQALEHAVTEAKTHFHQCTRCGKWVCPEVCWNAKVGLCETCAPDETEELAAQQALATAEQIATKVREQNLVKGMDLATKTGVNCCPKCGEKSKPGARFCAACGTALAQPAKKRFCAECGQELSEQKFCPQCGAKGE